MLCRFPSLVGAITAHVADISGNRGAGNYEYSSYGLRSEPIIIYDFEPGVLVRSYWDAPWNNRHYFPSTGPRPKVGQLEHVSIRRGIPPVQSME